jgi:predicted ATPase
LKIKKLHIKNFKSIADLEIIEPNPFTVFVGPNGSGKSNIFEALEFWNINQRFSDSSVADFFGGEMSFMNSPQNDLNFRVDFESNYFEMKKYISDDVPHSLQKKYFTFGINRFNQLEDFANDYHPNFEQFFRYFSRLFISKKDMQKLNNDGSDSLNFSSENLEKVLGRILKDKFKREELLEWSSLFIPEFEDVFIESNRNKDTLIVREKFSDKDFTKDLLSDGTYNILALLTAVFQSDEPQFLCIEEPENGLTPYVIREMVTLFRNACEEKGHYIWLNTHSQSLVSELTSDEIITVNKIKGETKIKQFKGKNFHGLRMDEAWLTNTLGGGLPW